MPGLWLFHNAELLDHQIFANHTNDIDCNFGGFVRDNVFAVLEFKE